MAVRCGCRDCTARPIPPNEWISDREYRAWKALRWQYDRDKARGDEGAKSRSPRRGYIPVGLVTLVKERKKR